MTVSWRPSIVRINFLAMMWLRIVLPKRKVIHQLQNPEAKDRRCEAKPQAASPSTRPKCSLSLRIVAALIVAACFAEKAAADEIKKNIVLIAGLKSHGPEGNGLHDYAWSVRLIKTMLEKSNIRDKVNVKTFLTGWPADPKALESADTIMVVSDGRDGDFGREAPHLASADRVRKVEELVSRGCGLMTFHFSTFAPDALSEKVLDWYGGHFDWETDGRRKWYSNITTIKAVVAPASSSHPVLRGVKPFKVRDEFYYDLRFRQNDESWNPIWTVDALPATKPHGKTVAWTVERKHGSRGFGTTCGHYYDNWKDEQFRKTILNALAWTAHLEVPTQGVVSRFYSHDEIAEHLQHLDALAAKEGPKSADHLYADEPYWYQPGHPLNPAEPRTIKTLPGFKAEKVYSIPRSMDPGLPLRVTNADV